MKRLWAFLCALLLLLPAGCAAPPPAQEEGFTLTATTYPVYLLACAVTEGAQGVRVERLATGSVSCLHDYTLSVSDMKKIERADVLALNGVELEAFMEDALAASDAAVIDCSAGVELLTSSDHDDHDHDHGNHDHDHGHWDPHIWLDPANAVQMANNLAAGLALADPDRGALYAANAADAAAILLQAKAELLADFSQSPGLPELITFHDGFAYFAHAFDLHLLRAIEEEAGSEASAREIVEITQLVRAYELPLIFTEVNGSDATARAISRETGCQVAQLSMLMDGSRVTDEDDIPSILARYTDALCANAQAILDGAKPQEVSSP